MVRINGRVRVFVHKSVPKTLLVERKNVLWEITKIQSVFRTKLAGLPPEVQLTITQVSVNESE